MIRPICISLLISGLLAACSDGDMPAQLGVSISIDLPDSVDPSTLSDALLTVYNVSNGSYTTLPVTNPANVPIDVLPGLYKISFSCHATLDNGAGAEVTGASHNCTITAATSISLKTYCVVVTDDLIISELFFTGTLQSSGNQYNGDQYIKLFNNTDHTIYADGLTIFESTFLTTQKFNYDPDVMPTAMTVQALYTIPGSGTDHPVEPGRELLIADIAIDHRAINPNSFDLSHADFEWYDESSNPKYADIDNPAVENLNKWYCYTNTIWQLHNRGFKAYGLARIPMGAEEYLAGYYYTCDYDQVTAVGTFPMSKSSYALPNEWIVDVVTCSSQADYVWNLSIPSLDSGWTWCSTMDGDKNRYFHAVRRGLDYIDDDGRLHLRDTNNSTADSNPWVWPSEIERQQSASDLSGTPCTTLTYDGITPIGNDE